MNKRPIPLFLFSLPRSGSTLVQRILATHGEIATAAEPHILLPFLFALKGRDVYSKYDHQFTAEAVRNFIRNLPDGSDAYFSELREFILRLYARSAGDQVKYFLDKTPKYSLVCEDILRLFPEAKIIFLWRNPLSVIASIIETWFNGRWLMHHSDFELYQGLTGLTAAYQKSVRQVLSLRYEDLILHPEATVRQVCDYLEIPYFPEMLSDFSGVKLIGRFRDPNSELEYFQVLRQDPQHKWKAVLNNPLRKRWCRRYLNWIGKERLETMGYDLGALLMDLDALPVTHRHLNSDMFWMSSSLFARVFESQIVKEKFRTWQNKKRTYMHK